MCELYVEDENDVSFLLCFKAEKENVIFQKLTTYAPELFCSFLLTFHE